MSEDGVPCLHITGDQEKLSETSAFVSLLAADLGDDGSASSSQLVAIDSSANIFLATVCTYNVTDDGNTAAPKSQDPSSLRVLQGISSRSGTSKPSTVSLVPSESPA
jgi:hypothetical protein